MRATRYVIEARDPKGHLLIGRAQPQPEDFFGDDALNGITADNMAKAIMRFMPEAPLDGRYVEYWPAIVNPSFIARVKTW